MPIFTTFVGNVSELLLKNNAGILVDNNDYKQWEKEFDEILSGKRVKVLKRVLAEEIFDWPNIAKRIINIYRDLSGQYYGEYW